MWYEIANLEGYVCNIEEDLEIVVKMTYFKNTIKMYYANRE